MLFQLVYKQGNTVQDSLSVLFLIKSFQFKIAVKYYGVVLCKTNRSTDGCSLILKYRACLGCCLADYDRDSGLDYTSLFRCNGSKCITEKLCMVE